MRLTLTKDLTQRLPLLYFKQPPTQDFAHAMNTNSKSFLNPLTAGCVLGVLLLLSAGSVRGDSEETIDQAASAYLRRHAGDRRRDPTQ